MKKILLTIALLMLLLTVVLAGCSGENESSEASSSLEATEISESSEESFVSVASDESTDDDIPEDAVKLLYTRYAYEKPTFIMIGTCAENASVTAQIGEETVTVPSYHGWFTASFTIKGSVHEVTFTQTVNGEAYDIPRTYNT